MKKYLSILLAVVLVLGFSASAFAIHASIPAETASVVSAKDVQIRLGGEIRVRGWYQDNITNYTVTENATTGFPYAGSSQARYDQRVRLAVDVKAGANLSGRILLETGSTDTGTPNNSTDVTVWGNLAATEGGRKQATLDTVVEAWIAYTGSGLFGVPAGIKIGHMPFMIGAGQFYDHRRFGDDAILLVIEPTKELELNFATVKVKEGSSIDNTDDTDLYTLMATYKVDKDNTVGANYTYVNNSDSEMSLQNIGLFARGKLMGLGYRAAVDFQFGDLTPTVKARGWAASVGLNYKLDPVTVRASFGYGSGDKRSTANKDEMFYTSLANVINYTVVYDYRVSTAAALATASPYGELGTKYRLGTGLSNTTYYNLGADFSPMKDLTLALDLFYLRASRILAPTGYGSDKEIGTEIDLKATYKIAKNLTYFINSGILFAGDFYKAAATGPTSDPKNAIVFHHGLTFSF